MWATYLRWSNLYGKLGDVFVTWLSRWLSTSNSRFACLSSNNWSIWFLIDSLVSSLSIFQDSFNLFVILHSINFVVSAYDEYLVVCGCFTIFVSFLPSFFIFLSLLALFVLQDGHFKVLFKDANLVHNLILELLVFRLLLLPCQLLDLKLCSSRLWAAILVFLLHNYVLMTWLVSWKSCVASLDVFSTLHRCLHFLHLWLLIGFI